LVSLALCARSCSVAVPKFAEEPEKKNEAPHQRFVLLGIPDD
jgi:hypothetical protein